MKAVWEFKVYDKEGKCKAFLVQAPTRPFAVDKGKKIARAKAPEAVSFECRLAAVVEAG